MQTRAIFGLGNPGRQYQDTRHNCGFRFIDRLASDSHVELKLIPRLQSHLVRTRIGDAPVWLVKPMSFMNRSGSAFRLVTSYYDIDPKDTIVVHDELDLPPGTVRLKSKGGDGGHNGISDIIQHNGGGEFLRIRLGIGRPRGNASTVPYVLSNPPNAEQSLIDDAITDTLQSLDYILAGKIEIAMNCLHSRSTGSDDKSAAEQKAET